MTKSRFDIEHSADDIYYASELLTETDYGTELLVSEKAVTAPKKKAGKITKKINVPTDALLPFIGKKLAQIENEIDKRNFAQSYAKSPEKVLAIVSDDSAFSEKLTDGILGRDPKKASILVPQIEVFKNISRAHLEIKVTSFGTFIKDISTNGTSLEYINARTGEVENIRLPKDQYMQVKEGNKLFLANAGFEVR